MKLNNSFSQIILFLKYNFHRMTSLLPEDSYGREEPEIADSIQELADEIDPQMQWHITGRPAQVEKTGARPNDLSHLWGQNQPAPELGDALKQSGQRQLKQSQSELELERRPFADHPYVGSVFARDKKSTQANTGGMLPLIKLSRGGHSSTSFREPSSKPPSTLKAEYSSHRQLPGMAYPAMPSLANGPPPGLNTQANYNSFYQKPRQFLRPNRYSNVARESRRPSGGPRLLHQRSTMSLRLGRLSERPRDRNPDKRFSSPRLQQMINKIQLIQKMQEAYELLQKQKEMEQPSTEQASQPLASSTSKLVDSQYILQLIQQDTGAGEDATETRKEAEEAQGPETRRGEQVAAAPHGLTRERSRAALLQMEGEKSQKQKKILVIGKNIKKNATNKDGLNPLRKAKQQGNPLAQQSQEAYYQSEVHGSGKWESRLTRQAVNIADQSPPRRSLLASHRLSKTSKSPATDEQSKGFMPPSFKVHTLSKMNATERVSEVDNADGQAAMIERAYLTKHEQFQGSPRRQRLAREQQTASKIETLYSKKSDGQVLNFRKEPVELHKKMPPASPSAYSSRNAARALQTVNSETASRELTHLRSNRYHKQNVESEGFNINDILQQAADTQPSAAAGDPNAPKSAQGKGGPGERAGPQQDQLYDNFNSVYQEITTLVDQVSSSWESRAKEEGPTGQGEQVPTGKLIDIQNMQTLAGSPRLAGVEGRRKMANQLELPSVHISHSGKSLAQGSHTDRAPRTQFKSKSNLQKAQKPQTNLYTNLHRSQFHSNSTRMYPAQTSNADARGKGLQYSKQRSKNKQNHGGDSTGEQKGLTRARSNKPMNFKLQGTAYSQVSATQSRPPKEGKLHSIETEEAVEGKAMRREGGMPMEEMENPSIMRMDLIPRRAEEESSGSTRELLEESNLLNQMNEFLEYRGNQPEKETAPEKTRVRYIPIKRQQYSLKSMIRDKTEAAPQFAMFALQLNKQNNLKKKIAGEAKMESQRIRKNFSEQGFAVEQVMNVRNYNPQQTKEEHDKGAGGRSYSNLISSMNQVNEGSSQNWQGNPEESADVQSFRPGEKSQTLGKSVLGELLNRSEERLQATPLRDQRSDVLDPVRASPVAENLRSATNVKQGLADSVNVNQTANKSLLEKHENERPSLQSHSSLPVNSKMYLRFVEAFQFMGTSTQNRRYLEKEKELHQNLQNRQHQRRAIPNGEDEVKEIQDLYVGEQTPVSARLDHKDALEERDVGGTKQYADQGEAGASAPEPGGKESRELNLNVTKKSSTNNELSQSLGVYSPALGPTKFAVSRGNAKAASSSKDSDQIIKQTIRSTDKTYPEGHAATYHGAIATNDYEQAEPSKSKKRRRSVLRLQQSARAEPMVRGPSTLNRRSMRATGYSNGQDDARQNVYNDAGDPPPAQAKYSNLQSVVDLQKSGEYHDEQPYLKPLPPSRKQNNGHYENSEYISSLGQPKQEVTDTERFGFSVESIVVGTGLEVLKIKPKAVVPAVSRAAKDAQDLRKTAEDERKVENGGDAGVYPLPDAKDRPADPNDEQRERALPADPSKAQASKQLGDGKILHIIQDQEEQVDDMGKTMKVGTDAPYDYEEEFTFDGEGPGFNRPSRPVHHAKTKILSRDQTNQTELELSPFFSKNSLERLKDLNINMDGFTELKEFIKALPSREVNQAPFDHYLPLDPTGRSRESPDRNQDLVRKASERVLPKLQPRREPTNFSSQKGKSFDRRDYRRKILRYRAAGKLKVEDQVQEDAGDRFGHASDLREADLSLIASKKQLSRARLHSLEVLKQDRQRSTAIKALEQKFNKDEYDLEILAPEVQDRSSQPQNDKESIIVIENQGRTTQVRLGEPYSYKIVSQRQSAAVTPKALGADKLSDDDVVSPIATLEASKSPTAELRGTVLNVRMQQSDLIKIKSETDIIKLKPAKHDQGLAPQQVSKAGKENWRQPAKSSSPPASARSQVNYQTNMVNEDLAKHYLTLEMLLCGKGNRGSLQERCRLLKQMILRLGENLEDEKLNSQSNQMRRDFEAIIHNFEGHHDYLTAKKEPNRQSKPLQPLSNMKSRDVHLVPTQDNQSSNEQVLHTATDINELSSRRASFLDNLAKESSFEKELFQDHRVLYTLHSDEASAVASKEEHYRSNNTSSLNVQMNSVRNTSAQEPMEVPSVRSTVAGSREASAKLPRKIQ